MEQIRRFFQEVALVLAALLRPLARSLRENSGLAVLSVVLAFGLWIFVTDAENPTVTRVLPIDLEVQPANVPSDVAVANDLATVRVRIRVSEVEFDSLTAADFEATVNLDGPRLRGILRSLLLPSVELDRPRGRRLPRVTR